MTTVYALHVEFTNHWAFNNLAAAENFLRSFAEDFLVGYTVDEVPPDHELIAAFNQASALPRIYACKVGGGSEEIIPFARAPEAT
jgi:hypothetical protein